MPTVFQLVQHVQEAFLAAAAAAASIPLVHLVALRTVRRSALTTPLAFPCFALSFALFFLFATLLGMPFDASRVLFGLGLLGFLCLGYLAVMFHLYRGFSNTLLTDVDRLGPADIDEMMRGFAEGAGSEEMLRRRLATMIAHDLIAREGRTLRLLPKGERSARISRLYKTVFRMDSTG